MRLDHWIHGPCQAVARDSVLSFGSSVRCGHSPYAETSLTPSASVPTEGDAAHVPPMVCRSSATLTGLGTSESDAVLRLVSSYDHVCDRHAALSSLRASARCRRPRLG